MPRSVQPIHARRSGAAAGGDITIRPARPSDDAALAALAALDSAPPLHGDRVVAEAGDRIVAALSTGDGRAVADPFVPSAGAVELLRVHAANAGGRGRGRNRAARRRRFTLPSLGGGATPAMA
ncbi:MAG: hypothetical protein QOJ21_3867 [Solirubrobacteraceae bacterium]|jgi:hypothetical protein|nr:hypothetical protein [Solirubrobacteraceae bacterium]